MRSKTIIATSMAGVVVADGAVPISPAGGVAGVGIVGAPLVSGTYVDCVGVCKPIFDVGAMCGLPVIDPALALNPANFRAYGGVWKRKTAGGPGPWGPWGGWGSAGYGGASYGGGWGGGYGGAGLLSQAAINCMCSTKVVDVAATEFACMTCLAKVTTVTNPCKFLSSQAVIHEKMTDISSQGSTQLLPAAELMSSTSPLHLAIPSVAVLELVITLVPMVSLLFQLAVLVELLVSVAVSTEDK